MNKTEERSKATPGPWCVAKVRMFKDPYYIHGPKDDTLGFAPIVARTMDNTSGPAMPNEANAALIAQAPDLLAQRDELLAACKALVELFRNSDMRPEDECHGLYTLMENAIARCAPADAKGDHIAGGGKMVGGKQ
jgi:hypothetical protein